MRKLANLAIVFLLCVGCGTESNQDGNNTNNATNNAEPITYYTHVKPLLDAYCVRCHVAGGVAPFLLDSYDAVLPVASLIPASIGNRSMPPFLAAPAVRPLKFDTSLSDDQIALITQWVDAGSVEGNANEEGDAITLDLAMLSRVDQTLTMPDAYTPTDIGDEYRCFVLDWPRQETSFITGLNVRPGNLEIAHHAAVYLIDEEHTASVIAAQGSDGKGPGYSCFGSATPPDTASFPTKLIGGWGPGINGLDFAEETGVRVDLNSKIVLQMHYSILEGGPQPDVTELDFRVDATVRYSAGNLPWLDLGWPSNPESMLIPAGSADTAHEYVDDPTTHPLFNEFVPGVDPSQGIIIYTVSPHLHKIGKKIWLRIERANGDIEPLVTVERFDFDWQDHFVLQDPVEVLPGDKIRLHCEWDNSAENQPVVDGAPRPVADVMWGEGSFEEMCAASMYVRGIAETSQDCADVGSVDADSGRFSVTFTTTDNIRNSGNLEGEMIGHVRGSIYRDEDVTLLGPNDGAQAVASLDFPSIDLRTGTDGPHLIDVELPAGDYQFLGFMDTDGNADANDPAPDVNDPVMIPARAFALQCEEQPVEVTFPLLLP